MWRTSRSPSGAARLRVGICLAILGAMRANASLGGGEVSVQADLAELQGVVTTTTTLDVELFEIRTDSGMVVREFANRAGIIFALSWSGPALPDLRQLLGPRFDVYTRVLARLQRPGLHRSVQVAAQGLVVESGGHLRAYFGRAFLSDELPAGFCFATRP